MRYRLQRGPGGRCANFDSNDFRIYVRQLCLGKNDSLETPTLGFYGQDFDTSDELNEFYIVLTEAKRCVDVWAKSVGTKWVYKEQNDDQSKSIKRKG